MDQGEAVMVMSDREQIAAGVFYTDAELAAKPWLRSKAVITPARQRDPNTGPVSAEAKALAATPGVCAYCWELPAGRSGLADSGQGPMHEECQAAWNEEKGRTMDYRYDSRGDYAAAHGFDSVEAYEAARASYDADGTGHHQDLCSKRCVCKAVEAEAEL